MEECMEMGVVGKDMEMVVEAEEMVEVVEVVEVVEAVEAVNVVVEVGVD